MSKTMMSNFMLQAQEAERERVKYFDTLRGPGPSNFELELFARAPWSGPGSDEEVVKAFWEGAAASARDLMHTKAPSAPAAASASSSWSAWKASMKPDFARTELSPFQTVHDFIEVFVVLPVYSDVYGQHLDEFIGAAGCLW